jgi:aconitate hydratase
MNQPDEFKTLRKFQVAGKEAYFHSLPVLAEQGFSKISRLPVSIRIVLESVLRNCDGKKVHRRDVETLQNRLTKKSRSWSRASFCRISRVSRS